MRVIGRFTTIIGSASLLASFVIGTAPAYAAAHKPVAPAATQTTTTSADPIANSAVNVNLFYGYIDSASPVSMSHAYLAQGWTTTTEFGDLRMVGYGRGASLRLFLREGTKAINIYTWYGTVKSCGWKSTNWDGKHPLPTSITITGTNGSTCTVTLNSVFVEAHNAALQNAPIGK